MKVYPIQTWMGSAYLLAFSGGMILVDTGAPGSEGMILRKMNEICRHDLSLIFITHAHFDHYGCAASLRRITHAKIAIHQGDAGAIASGSTILGEVRGRGKLGQALLPLVTRWYPPEPATADIVFDDGYVYDFGDVSAFAFHTPGHTVGSSCLFVDGNLFVGDLLSNLPKPHIQRYYAQDWDALYASLKRISSLGARRIYAGHGIHPLPIEDFFHLLHDGDAMM